MTYKMSLDCFPFDDKHIICLAEQPIGLDVAYNDNLFVSVTNKCQSINIYDLTAKEGESLLNTLKIGDDVVVEQVVYCQTGDYLACIGHKDSHLTVYTIFNWRPKDTKDLSIEELNISAASDPTNEQVDKKDKLQCLDACQTTGSLAIGCGDLVLIYEYVGSGSFHQSSNEKPYCNEGSNRDDSNNNNRDVNDTKENFQHIISIKLSMWALKVCLVENYLAITAMDHVQVLKLELLTLQIQPDSLEAELRASHPIKGVGSSGSGSNGSNGSPNNSANNSNSNNNGSNHCDQNMSSAKGFNVGSDGRNFADGAQCETNSITSTTIATTTSCSMISESNSTATNFSLFNTNGDDIPSQLNNSDMSIITLNQQQQQQQQQQVQFFPTLESYGDSNKSNDDCITWNLNTKKLVKLPTLMHNTSTNLSSFHICHPLELLGPASESIACRVSTSIYSQDFCQNQIEAVVLLCKQIDFEEDPVKSARLQAIYLNSHDDQHRLCKSAATHTTTEHDSNGNAIASTIDHQAEGQSSGVREASLLKSDRHELLASVTCFVSTHSSCFVYSLNGKKVTRLQTIAHPQLCLDLRPDLLNIYVLTSLGLQICSTGVCDSAFRYDWSSSSDLSLSFMAINRIRVLTTKDYIILVDGPISEGQCTVEYMKKPNLEQIYRRIVHTVNRCNSISIRSNLLTYLHATAQLALSSTSYSIDDVDRVESMLKSVTILLCKQLLQKKQTNVITNGRVDKAIKHLMDVSHCNLSELMRRHLDSLYNESNNLSRQFQSQASIDHHHHKDNNDITTTTSTTETLDHEPEEITTDDERPLDTDLELIKIYLKLSKHSQCLLDYLLAQSENESVCARIIGYIFSHNPRLLIKCAQKYPNDALGKMNDSIKSKGAYCVMSLLVEKLKQLAELDSTGINRATVLFTMAILYNALDERQKCLTALEQIIPPNHLAITMCSNYELSHSIAPVVSQHHPDAYNLFLNHLARRDRQAALDFARLISASVSPQVRSVSESPVQVVNPSDSADQMNVSVGALDDEDTMDCFGGAPNEFQRQQKQQQQQQQQGAANNNDGKGDAKEDDDDEGDLYEKKQKWISEIPPSELADLLSSDEGNIIDDETARNYLKASINLLESQFILGRLCENSH